MSAPKIALVVFKDASSMNAASLCTAFPWPKMQNSAGHGLSSGCTPPCPHALASIEAVSRSRSVSSVVRGLGRPSDATTTPARCRLLHGLLIRVMHCPCCLSAPWHDSKSNSVSKLCLRHPDANACVESAIGSQKAVKGRSSAALIPASSLPPDQRSHVSVSERR